jgi:hypothetical protein
MAGARMGASSQGMSAPPAPFFEGPSLPAHVEPAHCSPGPLAHRRQDAALVLDYATGSFSAAAAAVASNEERATSEALFIERASTTASRASRSARLLVWNSLCIKAGFSGPLTDVTVRTVVGALLRARYRSANAYFAAAKRQHIETYNSWDPKLDFIVAAEVNRACKRGLGPPSRAAPFPLLSIGTQLISSPTAFSELTVAPSAPRHPVVCTIIATWGLFREVEIANCSLADIRLNGMAKTLMIDVPASKADVAALGATVTLCCVCHLQLQAVCPYCHGRQHLRRRVFELGIAHQHELIDKPLFPSSTGEWPTKAGVIDAITKVATAAGELPTTRRGAMKWGGHAFRRGGAHLLAALGVSREDIKAIARHSSDAIDGYLDGANLTYITRLLPAALDRLASSPVAITALTASQVPVDWKAIAMVRGGKVHAASSVAGTAMCGWPWAASVSRCHNAELSSLSCRKCVAALRTRQASPSSSSSSSTSSRGSTASPSERS